MPVCYCKNSGGYGRFIPVVEQQPVKPKVEEEQEAEPAKHLTKRKTRVRCVETGMEFETVKQAGSALAALGLGKDAAAAAAAISNCMRTGGTAYGFHFVEVAA